MGKSYDIWSNTEYKVIGTIYENEAKDANKYSLRNIADMTQQMLDELRKPTERELIEKIFSLMTEEEKRNYEIECRPMDEKIEKLSSEHDKLSTDLERNEKTLNTIVFIPVALGFIWMVWDTISDARSGFNNNFFGILISLFFSSIVYALLAFVIISFINFVFLGRKHHKINKLQKEIESTRELRKELIYKYNKE